MRDPNRIPIVLERVRQVWEANPQWRLGQLLCTVAEWKDLYYLEDEEVVHALRTLERLLNRRENE